jgi:ribosomal protein S7
MMSETQLEHRLQIARVSALTMRVLYLRRLAERLRWLVQQTQESGNVERAESLAKELAKIKATLQTAEQEVALPHNAQRKAHRAGETIEQ